VELEVEVLTENSWTEIRSIVCLQKIFLPEVKPPCLFYQSTDQICLVSKYTFVYTFFSLLLLQMLLVKWHNWKMPSKNIKSKRPNAKCTLLAKPPKLTVMKPTDLWPNKSMTFSGKKQKFFFILSHDLLLSLYFF
jgi:hypothetical protein